MAKNLYLEQQDYGHQNPIPFTQIEKYISDTWCCYAP